MSWLATSSTWPLPGPTRNYTVFNRPADLADNELSSCLAENWAISGVELSYQTVGFGSHHWVAAAGGVPTWFVTVDDLRSCLVSATDSPKAAFDRLARAFGAARLLADAGLQFVLGPIPALDGSPTARIGERFSVVVHPFVIGEPAGVDGEYQDPARRLLMASHLVRLHAATPAVADLAVIDDLSIPLRDELEAALADLGRTWEGGPYSERAHQFLAREASGVSRILSLYDRLADEAFDASRLVITHGEPHAGNVIVTQEGLRLVDWESARLALPERDLWDLDPGDGSVFSAYRRLSGLDIDQQALALYRLWYDLFEIAGYVVLFRGDHDDDADAAESWKNLSFFLRPDSRWPPEVWSPN